MGTKKVKTPAGPAAIEISATAAKLGPDVLPPAHVRIYTDGNLPGRRQPLLGKVIAVTTLMLFIGWLTHFMPLLVLFACFSRVGLYVLLALCGTLLLPAKPVLWKAFNRHWVFRTWREYFQMSFLCEEVLDPQKRYILVQFPHGAFPIAAATAGTLMQSLFPNITFYGVAASTVFMVPGWRHIMSWLGCLPATVANMHALLRRGSLAVIVGGIAEMYMLDPDAERIKLRGRKGFARVAIEAQIDGIVPVYFFGQTQLLSFGPAWLSKYARRWRTAVGVLSGRWGLPLPRKVPIFMVSGRALPVPRTTAAPGSPEFEALAGQLVETVAEELQALYDRHRALYGWDRPLIIE